MNEPVHPNIAGDNARMIAFPARGSRLVTDQILPVGPGKSLDAPRAARAVAANTPVQLAAARQSEAQARARYQAGLASIIEVADTQSLLAQAEFQDEIARVDVWRALLAEAVAQGTLMPFLSLVHPSSGGR
jgi:hypothetical protein